MVCGACGFAWTERGVVAPEAYVDQYWQEATPRSYFDAIEDWRHQAAVRLGWLSRHGIRPTRLLEIGCAGGFFLSAARDAGITVQGIEPSRDLARYAKADLGLQVEVGTFEDLALHGPFDAVCAFHVFEHVVNWRTFLAKARRIIAPDGWLILETPNIASSRAVSERSSWSHLQPRFHRWHFSTTTLGSALRTSGFSVELQDTVFPRYYARSRTQAAYARAFISDIVTARTLKRVHARRGDFVRVIARPAR